MKSEVPKNVKRDSKGNKDVVFSKKGISKALLPEKGGMSKKKGMRKRA